MTSEISLLKAGLREQFRAIDLAIEPAARRAASATIVRQLRQSDLWQQSQAILLYAPLPREPDIWPVAEDALAAGKTVTLPRYFPERQGYGAAQITDPAQDLQPGRFQIREPASHCALIPLNQLDLALVPGVVFDSRGSRVGRGKGFYDRLLAEVTGMKVGVAFDWQMHEGLPTEPHDAVLNCILTPTRWWEVPRQRPV